MNAHITDSRCHHMADGISVSRKKYSVLPTQEIKMLESKNTLPAHLSVYVACQNCFC